MVKRADKKDNSYKGAEFLADVKCQLFLERFVTAIPEPDVGEDLWVIDSTGRGNPDDAPLQIANIFRCQLKSAHSSVREGRSVKHTVNFKDSNSARFSSGFFFLVGLRHTESDRFRVGCIPGEFFGKLNAQGNLRLTSEGRTMLDFFTTKENGGYKYEMRMKYPPKPGKERGRGPRKDLTEFFDHCTLREAFAYATEWAA